MTVGSLCARANSKIRENSVPVSMGSLWISRASLDDASMLENAAFRSAGLAASTRHKVTPRLLAQPLRRRTAAGDPVSDWC